MRQWMLGMVLVVLALGWVVAAQADYADGQRAWDAGRHSEALHEWQAAANAGDAKAMLALGRLYVQGLGAPQNYVQAHTWFNLAASRGEAEAVTERDALAGRMAPEQVAKAQDQAAAWQPEPAKAPATSAARGSAGPPPPKAIREAQQLLDTLGYEPDSDGQWGERTAQAYQAFVRDANLPKTDTLTPSALKTMRAMARQAGAVRPQAQGHASAGCAAPGGQGRKPERAGSGPGCRHGRERTGRQGLDGADVRGGQGLRAARGALAAGEGRPRRPGAGRGHGPVHGSGARPLGDHSAADESRSRPHDQGAEGEDGEGTGAGAIRGSHDGAEERHAACGHRVVGRQDVGGWGSLRQNVARKSARVCLPRLLPVPGDGGGAVRELSEMGIPGLRARGGKMTKDRYIG